MPYAILPAATATSLNNSDYICRLDSNGSSSTVAPSLNDINNKYTPSPTIQTNKAVSFSSSLSDSDISKHLESLRTRLGLARFKMNQGWESSTFGDVQQLWKKRQQRLIDDLPKPRFTQRDIIDKRVYIPSPGAKHAKTKKSKLTRTLSSPITTNDFHQHQYQLSSNPSICSQQQPDVTVPATDTAAVTTGHCSRSRKVIDSFPGKRSLSISSPVTFTSPITHSPSSSPEPPQPLVRNSLDFLSYAIAMKENDEKCRSPSSKQARLSLSQPLPSIGSSFDAALHSSADEDDNQPIHDISITQYQKQGLASTEDDSVMDCSERHASFSLEDQDNAISPPSSPMTTAAKAILMFSNNNNDDQNQHRHQRSDSSELSIPNPSSQ